MVMTGRQFIIGLLSLFYTTQILAGIVTGELDKVKGTIDDIFVYTLTVQGRFSSQPDFPEIKNADVSYQGMSQNVTMTNNTYVSENTFSYGIRPKKHGTYRIPSITMKVDGKLTSSAPLEFSVVKASASTQTDTNQDIFIKRTLSKDTLYIGEALLSRVEIYRRVRWRGASPVASTDEHFKVIPIDGEKKYRRNINGTTYEVVALEQILVAKKSGKIEVEPFILDTQLVMQNQRSRRPGGFFDDFFQSGRVIEKRFRSNTNKLHIKPLPREGRTKEFSGLIGKFDLISEIDKSVVNAGDSITLSLSVKGVGQTTGMKDPKLELSDGVKVYADKPEDLDRVSAKEGLVGVRIFKWAIVPSKSGEYELGKIKLNYFNTELGKYETLVADIGKIAVKGSTSVTSVPSMDSSTPSVKKEDVKLTGSDIIASKSTSSILNNRSFIGLSDILYGSIVVLVALLGLFSVIFSQYLSSNEELLKRRKLRKAAAKNFNLAMEKADATQYESILRKYFTDRFSVNAEAFTFREFIDYLKSSKMKSTIIDEATAILSELERRNYAPASIADTGLSKKLEDFVKELEKNA